MRAVGMYRNFLRCSGCIVLSQSQDIKNEVGDADALFINENVPTPVPKEGELLVRIKVY
jgi:hypothetical protein